MAYFAKLDNENKVIAVHTIDNSVIDANNEESTGITFLNNLYGIDAIWKQTSYNGKIRGNFAAIGYTYLPLEDIFMPPKCHEEAVLNAKAAKWECTNTDHDIKELS